ncbi:MAG: 3-octaprenyl-4-hydroxybenzoate carboxy-lyase [Chloroflexi bacterium]|nr:3-octaprenyl-4-hydroxybenzoate carboxy-lyase [Chloroflexota bacterium]
MRLVVGISGSTGAIYGVRLLEVLRNSPDIETHLVVSDPAKQTIEYETGWSARDVCDMATVVYDYRDIGAAISSGSFPVDGMVIAPCSIKSLSSVANSYNDNLLTRAADVQLKERRKLVMVVRETPLHRGHLKLMLEVTEAGAVVLPPVPSFYHLPKTIDDIVNHTVQKVLDQFGIEKGLFQRWTGLKTDARVGSEP